MLRRYILFLKQYPIITAIIAIVYVMTCITFLKVDTNFKNFLLRTLYTGATIFFLYQVSGDKTLTASYNSTWYVVKIGIGFWVVALAVGLLGFMAKGDSPLWDNIPLQILTSLLFYLSVGVFEEMAFRALINDAMIYQFRNAKHLFFWCAAVSSLAFGAAHVVGANLGSFMEIAQAVGKTLQSGAFGLSLLFLYWKTRNIWACGVVHGMYDFFISLSNCFYDIPRATSYVMTGERGKLILGVYIVFTIINLFIFYLIYRKIGKKIDYQKMREEW